jgi:hypothetical protein
VIAESDKPGRQVTIDLARLYIVNRYSWTLIVVIDRWSRKTWVTASRKTPTEKDKISWIEKRIMEADGIDLEEIVSDNRTQFNNNTWESYWLSKNVKPTRTSFKNPQANGLAKRKISEIKK